MKIIELNGQSIMLETDGKNWYCRFNDCLIIRPTIKEIKKCIKEGLNNL